MAYQLADIEITDPIPDLTLTSDENGIGVVVRHHGRPVGFFLKDSPPHSEIPAEQLEALVRHHAGTMVLHESLRASMEITAETSHPRSLTVAICTRDHPNQLRRLLESWTKLRKPTQIAIDLIVVDNAPTDTATREVVGHFPEARYVMEPVPGLDFARNRALDESADDWIAFLDDDVVVDPGWLEGFIEAWQENPNAGGFTGLVLPYCLDTPAQIFFEEHGGFRRGFKKRWFPPKRMRGCPAYPCVGGEYGAGCNMILRRQLVVDLGGFDEALDTGPPLPGGGDLDIFYQITNNGHAIAYEPSMLVFHEHRKTTRQLLSQYWSWGASMMAQLTKCAENDPDNRAPALHTVWWWTRHHGTRLIRGLIQRDTLLFRAALAEAAGGVQGLCGEYRRSQKRVRKRVEDHQAALLSRPQ